MKVYLDTCCLSRLTDDDNSVERRAQELAAVEWMCCYLPTTVSSVEPRAVTVALESQW